MNLNLFKYKPSRNNEPCQVENFVFQQSEDVGEGGEGAKKDVGYRVLPNLKKLFIKIQYTN